MKFNIGESVILTIPEDSIFYKYYNGLTGNVIKFNNRYGRNLYLIHTDTESFYMREEFLCRIEEEENIKIEDIFNIM